MLTIIQIVTLIQGIFLITVLFINRRSYKNPSFILLLCVIFSILLFLMGDDQNNLISSNVDWFFLDASLFITFLFLFVKYYVNPAQSFNKNDLLYFIPNVLYLVNEVIETTFDLPEVLLRNVFELLIELSFFGYLLLTLGLLFRSTKQRWMIYFILPLSVLVSTSIINEVLGWFSLSEIELFNEQHFKSFMLITVAVLFYVITMKLVVAPGQVMAAAEEEKYKSSGLNKNMVEEYKRRIVAFMEKDEGFRNAKLSLYELSRQTDIPKQYISEILNVHLGTNFQDFVNNYRVEAFTHSLEKEEYTHYSLLGIASEVGFNSKSGFYATFKKHKGMTPSEYKKSISERVE